MAISSKSSKSNASSKSSKSSSTTKSTSTTMGKRPNNSVITENPATGATTSVKKTTPAKQEPVKTKPKTTTPAPKNPTPTPKPNPTPKPTPPKPDPTPTPVIPDPIIPDPDPIPEGKYIPLVDLVHFKNGNTVEGKVPSVDSLKNSFRSINGEGTMSFHDYDIPNASSTDQAIYKRVKKTDIVGISGEGVESDSNKVPSAPSTDQAISKRVKKTDVVNVITATTESNAKVPSQSSTKLELDKKLEIVIGTPTSSASDHVLFATIEDE